MFPRLKFRLPLLPPSVGAEVDNGGIAGAVLNHGGLRRRCNPSELLNSIMITVVRRSSALPAPAQYINCPTTTGANTAGLIVIVLVMMCHFLCSFKSCVEIFLKKKYFLYLNKPTEFRKRRNITLFVFVLREPPPLITYQRAISVSRKKIIPKYARSQRNLLVKLWYSFSQLNTAE